MMRLATGEAAAVESTCTAYVLEARNSASRDLGSSSEAAWRGWGRARELSAAAARPTLPRSRIRRLLAGRVPIDAVAALLEVGGALDVGDSWWRITITGQRAIDTGERTEPRMGRLGDRRHHGANFCSGCKQLPPKGESVPECASQDNTQDNLLLTPFAPL